MGSVKTENDPTTVENPGNAEEQLRRERQLRDELCSSISHDMRSPVGAINIFCELLVAKPDGLSDSQIQNIRMVAEASAKLQRIIEDTVEIARIHARTIALHKSEFNPRDLVQKVVAEVRSTAEQRKVRIVEQYAAGEVLVFADAARFEQVFLRIIADAVKCARPEASLSIQDRVEKNTYFCTYRIDSDAERCRRVFEESSKGFFPRGRLGVRAPAESHFNWAASESLVEMHGGKVQHALTEDLFTASVEIPLQRTE